MVNEGKIGYKHPPKDHQFKKGVSGNRHGRPKKIYSFEDLIIKELNRKTKIKEDGKTKTVTWLEIIIKTIVHKGMSGDTRALEIIEEYPQAFPKIILIELKLGDRVLKSAPLTPEEERQLQALYDPKPT